MVALKKKSSASGVESVYKQKRCFPHPPVISHFPTPRRTAIFIFLKQEKIERKQLVR